jgi:4-amino-4-deoxy-L-arabinose transferase-like glycosyltransferase
MSNVAPPRGRALGEGPERAVGARGDGWPRAWIFLAVGLLLLALLVRVAYVLHTRNFWTNIDASSYNLLASGLAQGHGWVLGSSAYRPPGYPFFLAGVYLVFGVPHTSWTDPRLVQAVLLSTVTVGLIGLMAWQVAGRGAALISMAIGALYTPLVLVGASLMTEALFVPLVLGATNCALYSRRAQHSRRWVVAAGFLTGLAALTRGNGLVVGLALALVVWGAKPRLSWRAVASPALLLVVMCLTVLPWTVRNAIAQHAFIPVTTELGTTLGGEYNTASAKHHFLWQIGGYHNYDAIKHDKSISEATRDSRLTSAVINYLEQHPTYLPQAIFWNTMRLWDLQGPLVWQRSARADTDATAAFSDLGAYSFWLVGLFAIGGLFTRAARRVPRSLWAVPFLIWLSEAAITTGTPRFEAALDPFVIMLAAFAVQALARAILPGRARSRSLGATPAPA